MFIQPLDTEKLLLHISYATLLLFSTYSERVTRRIRVAGPLVFGVEAMMIALESTRTILKKARDIDDFCHEQGKGNEKDTFLL
jgi:hypothetical protein